METVRYEMVNAMLLNEFLKEHGKSRRKTAGQEQEATITQQQKRNFEALKRRRIQKVSAQVEMSLLRHKRSSIISNK